jgi:hypothetical protein
MEFPEQIELQISQDDVKQGLHGDCSRCPTALALLKVYPDLNDIMVDYRIVNLIVSDKIWAKYIPSPELTIEMRRYDGNTAKMNFRPGKYTLLLLSIVKGE